MRSLFLIVVLLFTAAPVAASGLSPQFMESYTLGLRAWRSCIIDEFNRQAPTGADRLEAILAALGACHYRGPELKARLLEIAPEWMAINGFIMTDMFLNFEHEVMNQLLPADQQITEE